MLAAHRQPQQRQRHVHLPGDSFEGAAIDAAATFGACTTASVTLDTRPKDSGAHRLSVPATAQRTPMTEHRLRASERLAR
jgi:hypothetical protein